MPSMERLFRAVGGAVFACGVLIVAYGALAGDVDAIALLAGVFTAVVGLTLLAAGVVWPRLDGPDSRRA